MNIRNYFAKPEPGVETKLIQGRMPIKLIKTLKPFMKENHLTWTDIMLGSFQALADEVKGKKK
jgi:hypothetical protein